MAAYIALAGLDHRACSRRGIVTLLTAAGWVVAERCGAGSRSGMPGPTSASPCTT
jgi:hypothetical protein